MTSSSLQVQPPMNHLIVSNGLVDNMCDLAYWQQRLSVAIWTLFHLLDLLSGTVSMMTVRQVTIVVVERSQGTRKAFSLDFHEDFTEILTMPILFFHICVVKIIRQSLLAGPFGRVSQPIYFLTVCLAISSFLDIWAMLSPSDCNSLTSLNMTCRESTFGVS